ncbi:DEAD/DEAH box helicase [Agrococcus sp. SL85]|uniref:DEAD/DEAH box helicase n=1 Tax=Agrococcus sp. SL85 TaxID=2995141 RepID=UPI00226CF01A|nr:DEAD/DEAH box helicase [Agrococcus sp. SL85]WAC67296.1 DEAD/DEAH box helicase [Agrococcus sp. SL85]
MARPDDRPGGARRPNDRPGSRSQGHRGYRDEQPGKRRWSDEDRDRRAQRGGPGGQQGGSRRPNWTPPEERDRERGRGPAFRTRGDARGGRDHQRDDRLHRGERPRGFDRSRDEHHGRGPRRDDRGFGDRPRRFEDRDDRPRRFEDRGPRRDVGGDRRDDRRQDDRPRRFEGRDERGPRRDFGDRPRRFEDREERGPRRDFGDRGPRRDFGGDRRDERGPRRDFGGDRREERGPRRDFGGDRREERGPRRDFGDRPRRFEDRDERGPRRDFGGARREERGPRRDFGDRPRRFEDREDRGPRRDVSDRRDDRRQDDRPRRFEDRAPREDRRDERPHRDRDAQPRRDSTYYPSNDAKPFEAKEDVVLERLEAQATAAADVEGVTFADLGLGAGIAGALKSMGAETPFPIQAATIPDVLAGKDVLGRGRTGSGKTIAFGSPIVELLLRNRPERREIGRPPRALILAPTRELAQQINHTVMGVGRAVGIFTTVIVGGVRQGMQVESLRRGVDILIGTPGRIEDLVEQGVLNLGAIEIAVVDEADHMCELGFLEPVQRILRRTRPGSQKLLFSATLDAEVATIVREFLPEPAVHEVAGEDQATSTIDHQVLVTDRYDKDAVLEQIVRNPGRIVVFTRTRAYAERLQEQFTDAGVTAVSLHGDLTQARRNRSLEKLRRGKVDVLVATDVAARGIHIDDVALVVQADPPDEYKTYLHRSGRTGRAGRDGRVVTVIAPARRKRMQQLLERAEIEAPMLPVVPGDDLLDTLTVIEAAEAEAVEAPAAEPAAASEAPAED